MTCHVGRHGSDDQNKIVYHNSNITVFEDEVFKTPTLSYLLVYQRQKLLAFRDCPFLKTLLRYPNLELLHLSLPPFTRLLLTIRCTPQPSSVVLWVTLMISLSFRFDFGRDIWPPILTTLSFLFPFI